ncbi:MAG: hypothetical protein SAK29_41465 [Scytonema sp. PMC 1069.18]|nr:hypothetical protein [Scytonema sp. PMC 1069.18]MEC4887475.1 hypothetical protein [Scytonema sp. PMC 1070.18]
MKYIEFEALQAETQSCKSQRNQKFLQLFMIARYVDYKACAVARFHSTTKKFSNLDAF